MIYQPRLTAGSLLLGLLLAFAPALSAQAQDAADHTHASDHTHRATAAPDAVVHVKGMVCQMCAKKMTAALEALEAVEKADVQLEEQQALLTLRDGQTVSEDEVRAAVGEAGFEFRELAFPADEPAPSDASDAR